jgi:hypothetical protein
MRADDQNRPQERDKTMKTANTSATPHRPTARKALGGCLLLLTTALLLQGCGTIRPAWSHETDDPSRMSSHLERTEPREGIALLNIRF